jgi:hypothetical protein
MHAVSSAPMASPACLLNLLYLLLGWADFTESQAIPLPGPVMCAAHVLLPQLLTSCCPAYCFACRVSLVVLPLLFGAVSLNYLDRTALSFASLQLNSDLELSTQQYGLAAATFALGGCSRVWSPGCSVQQQLPRLDGKHSTC